MLSVWEQLSRQLDEREALHLRRQRRVVESPRGAWAVVDGRPMLCFCSNDYLGLAGHPKLVEACAQAVGQYGVGSGASHLVCGHSREHHLLEEEFAASTGRDRALLFSSGYMANLGVITALCDKTDAILEDKLNHASLIDAALLSGAKLQRYRHNDITSLQGCFDRGADVRRKLLCVDGVFSMDGDLAPLPDLARIAAANDALLMVDDAHGFGVLGQHGRGSCDHYGLSQTEVPVLMCTLGKALGSFGAIVAGPDLLIETLIQLARPYIYTTALPPAIAAATRASLQLLETEGWRREILAERIRYFRTEATNIGLPLAPSATAIQPLLLGEASVALQWQQRLWQNNIWITAIRPPTVPRGTARLRITLSAAHTTSDVDQLLTALLQASRELPVQGAA